MQCLEAVLVIVLSLGGCAAFTPIDVAKPSSITLSNATDQVADSLIAMKNKLDANRTKFGLIIDEVDVDLNVTAVAGQNAGEDLKIDVSKTALAGVGLTADINGQQTSSAQRQNAIHMVFKNLATAPLNCVGYSVFKTTKPDGVSNFGAAPAAPGAAGGATGGGSLASPTSCGPVKASMKPKPAHKV